MATFKYGKKPYKHDERTLMFHRYVKPGLPPPKPSHSNLERIAANLGTRDFPSLFPIDGNDTYGDCVVAGAAHAETVFNGLIGKRVVFPDADVIKTYLHITGGADDGLVMLEFLKFWRKYGFDGHKIEGFARISVRDHENVRRAIELFGGVYLGFRVQADAIRNFEHHQMWEPGPADGGHCVDAVDYTPELFRVLTWGDVQDGSVRWWDAQVDESYAILPPEAREEGFAPGIDFATLFADLSLITA